MGPGTGHHDSLLDGLAILPFEGERLFDDEMFARLRCGDGVFGVVLRVTAHRNHVDAFIRQHGIEILKRLDGRTVSRADLGGIQRAVRIDRRDLAQRSGVDGGNVRGRGPAVTDETDIVAFHAR